MFANLAVVVFGTLRVKNMQLITMFSNVESNMIRKKDVWYKNNDNRDISVLYIN